MVLDVDALTAAMLRAAKGSLARDWKKVAKYAELEFGRLATSLRDIAGLIVTGTIDEQEASALLRIHKNTTVTVFLAVKGMALVATEQAVNAALGAVRTAVNKAAGVVLL